MTRRGRIHAIVVTCGFLVSGALLAAPSAFSQDLPKDDAPLALRKDPHFARLYHDAKAFMALPPARQKAMRKLHEELQKLPPAERLRLTHELKRYADWLDRLPDADRKAVVAATNKQARLRTITKIREKEWIGHLPETTKQYLDKVSRLKPNPAADGVSALATALGTPRQMRPLTLTATIGVEKIALNTDLRAETIKRLKRDETYKARDWNIAVRHWPELIDAKRPIMPTHPDEFGQEVEHFIKKNLVPGLLPKEQNRLAQEFGQEVENYVKQYLVPVLSPDEQNRLAQAEGHWPQYPMTLVELADKHPLALPQDYGPTAFVDLPTEVKEKLSKFPAVSQKKKNIDQVFRNSVKVEKERLNALIPLQQQTLAIEFAFGAANWVHTRPKAMVQLPHELWAAKPSDLSFPMRQFLNVKGPLLTQLNPDEANQLKSAAGKWPDYPMKIQKLAKKYGMKPPWQSLPDLKGKQDFWDTYRPKPRKQAEAPMLPQLQRDVAISFSPGFPWRGPEAAPLRVFSVQALP